MTGSYLVKLEREHQKKLGYTTEYDVKNNKDRQLAKAARKLLVDESEKLIGYPPPGWDMDKWNKMAAKPYKERIVIAAALAVAEVDRLNY